MLVIQKGCRTSMYAPRILTRVTNGMYNNASAFDIYPRFRWNVKQDGRFSYIPEIRGGCRIITLSHSELIKPIFPITLFSWNTCTKPRMWVVMYMCVKIAGFVYVSLTISIRHFNCSDGVVVFAFKFNLLCWWFSGIRISVILFQAF